jgi:hypothetical protein
LGNNNLHRFKQAGFVVSLFCFFILLHACNRKGEILAQVDDYKLYNDDAEHMMLYLGLDLDNKQDKEQVISIWINQILYTEELKKVDLEKAKITELRGAAFKGELAKYYLEEINLMASIDSTVSDKELKKYYENHQSEFTLNDYILKALYVKVPKEAKIIDKLKKHYLLKNDKDLARVNSYAKLYAESFYFDDEQWIYFNDFAKDIPIKKYNKDNLVLNRTKTYFEDENYVYFINIIDYKVKDSAPPFEFFKDQIKEIIIAQRINAIRENNEEEYIQKLKNKHEIIIHHK